MSQTLSRLTALLLIPCLLAGPSPAKTIPGSPFSENRTRHFLFSEQALAVSGDVFPEDSITRISTSKVYVQAGTGALLSSHPNVKKVAEDAIAKAEAGNKEEAISMLRNVYRTLPKIPKAIVPLINAAIQIGDYNWAEKQAMDLVNSPDPDSRSFSLLANVLYRKGNLEGALWANDEEIHLAPDNARAYGFKAMLLSEKRWYRDAVEASKMEISLNVKQGQDNAASHRFLAKLYAKEGDLNLIIAERRRELELSDDPQTARQLKMLEGEKARQIQEAERITQILLKNSDQAWAWEDLATIYYSLGYYLKALHAYQRQLYLDPSNLEVIHPITMMLEKLKRFDDARLYVGLDAKAYPLDADVQGHYAYLCEITGKTEEAILVRRNQIRNQIGDWRTYKYLILDYLVLGRKVQAEEMARLAYERYKDYYFIRLLSRPLDDIRKRNTIPAGTNEFGNPYAALTMPMLPKSAQSAATIGKIVVVIVNLLVHRRLYYNLGRIHLDRFLSYLQDPDIPGFLLKALEGLFIWDEAALTAYRKGDAGPYVMGQMEKNGPAVVRLQKEVIDFWSYKSAENLQNGLTSTQNDQLEKAFETVIRRAAKTEDLKEAFRKYPRLREMRIEIRDSHDWLGEADPVENTIILHRSLLDQGKKNDLLLVMMEEVRHLATGRRDSSEFFRETLIDAAEVAGVRAVMNSLFGFGHENEIKHLFAEAARLMGIASPTGRRGDENYRQEAFEKILDEGNRVHLNWLFSEVGSYLLQYKNNRLPEKDKSRMVFPAPAATDREEILRQAGLARGEWIFIDEIIAHIKLLTGWALPVRNMFFYLRKQVPSDKIRDSRQRRMRQFLRILIPAESAAVVVATMATEIGRFQSFVRQHQLGDIPKSLEKAKTIAAASNLTTVATKYSLDVRRLNAIIKRTGKIAAANFSIVGLDGGQHVRLVNKKNVDALFDDIGRRANPQEMNPKKRIQLGRQVLSEWWSSEQIAADIEKETGWHFDVERVADYLKRQRGQGRFAVIAMSEITGMKMYVISPEQAKELIAEQTSEIKRLRNFQQILPEKMNAASGTKDADVLQSHYGLIALSRVLGIDDNVLRRRAQKGEIHREEFSIIGLGRNYSLYSVSRSSTEKTPLRALGRAA